MSLTDAEQALLQTGLQAIPPIFRDNARLQDDLRAMAKMAGAAQTTATAMINRARIGTASKDASGPDWLDLIAQGLGTHRVSDESDAACRARITAVPTGVVRSELLALIRTIAGTQDVAMVELPRDATYLGRLTRDEGTAGTFYKVGSVMTFVPAVAFAYPPFRGTLSGRVRSTTITFASATSAGNDGTFTITGLAAMVAGDGVTYTNTSGVAEADATCVWHTERLDHRGAAIRGSAYVNRGFRVWRGGGPGSTKNANGGIVVILPYGTTESIRLQVLEMLRQRKAGGFMCITERRVTP